MALSKSPYALIATPMPAASTAPAASAPVPSLSTAAELRPIFDSSDDAADSAFLNPSTSPETTADRTTRTER